MSHPNSYAERLSAWVTEQLRLRRLSPAKFARELERVAGFQSGSLSDQSIRYWRSGKWQSGKDIQGLKYESRQMLARYRSEVEKAVVPGKGEAIWTVQDIDDWLEGRHDDQPEDFSSLSVLTVPVGATFDLSWAYSVSLSNLYGYLGRLSLIASFRAGLTNMPIQDLLRREFAAQGLDLSNRSDVDHFMTFLITDRPEVKDKIRAIVEGRAQPAPRDFAPLAQALTDFASKPFSVDSLTTAHAID